jgi:hypothetical protein
VIDVVVTASTVFSAGVIVGIPVGTGIGYAVGVMGP